MAYKAKRVLFSYFLLFLVSLLLAYAYSCSNQKEPSTDKEATRIARGKQLAQIYCRQCHMAAPPQMLPKKKWTQSVLPAMAKKLGIEVWSGTEYYLKPGTTAKYGITIKKWRKIVAYFREKSPDSLEVAKPQVLLQNDETLFEVVKPEIEDGKPEATTTLVAFSPDNQSIYTAGVIRKKLYRWDQQLQPHYIKTFDSPPVDIQFLFSTSGNKQLVVTAIGTMKAVNSQRGRVLKLSLNGEKTTVTKSIAKSLPRPVESVAGDFNNDGLRDWVVAGFGHEIGALYLATQQPDGTFQQSIIRKAPGAEDIEVGDFNQDGWPDLMVLFAHGNEGIWLFMNNQQGGFKMRSVLRFPPVYGSTSFELVDFNEDGQIDILYTNGDNADYSAVLKPYHGVRIFINKGHYQYKEAYFYPIHGAYEAIARDFDGDGDQDIATIAFFPDFKHKPDKAFLYFEQKTPLHFTPHAVSVYKQGRWISMDAGDFDDDGDPDIVLGNFSRGFRKSVKEGGVKPYWDEYTPFVLLMNRIE